MTEKGWKSFSAEAVVVQARFMLKFSVGDVIHVVEAMDGWYKAVHFDTKETGLFPASFFRTKPSEEGKDPVMRELHNVFREWGDLLKKLYLSRKYQEFNVLSERLKTLFSWNKALASPHTPPDALAKMKSKVMASIEEGRQLMGLDLFVRTAAGEVATEKNCSIIELYRKHQELDRRVLSSVVPRLLKKESRFSQGGSLVDQDIEFMLPLHHIMLQMVVFQCKVSEPTELRFSVYNAHTKTFISEEYPVMLTVHGMPAEIGRINNLKTVFTDIDDKELAEGKLHLVCYLIRMGQMHVDKVSKGTNKFRRPYACAVMKLTAARILDEASRGLVKLNLKDLNEVYGSKDPTGKLVEQRMVIYNTPQESSFPDIHELIMRNSNSVMEVPRSLGITIGLKLLLGEYPSLLQRVPHLQEITVSQRMSVQPAHHRNDFYLTIDSGELTQDRKRAAKNVEVTITVRDTKGNDVQGVLIPGAGEAPVGEWKSVVYYHNNTPRWNETLKLDIPPHKFRDYHLYFTLRHCTTSGKSNAQKVGGAYTFLRLTDFAGSIHRDGQHSLNTYKPQKADDLAYYLRDPQKVVQRKGEFLKIRTLLCSTYLTQHPGLMDLLNWKSHNRNELPEILKRITFVERPEMMKFLRPTIEAMFHMFHAHADDENLHTLVYDALICVLGMFAEDRMLLFVNFPPTINTMIQSYEQYDPATAAPEEKERVEVFAHVHLYLVPCVQRSIKKSEQPGFNITPTLKALEYTMKFIIVSRMLHTKHFVVKDDTFKLDMMSFFDSFTGLMKCNSPHLIGAQTLALKNVVLWFQGLLLLFSEMEMASVVLMIIKTLSHSDKKQLNQARLAVLKEIVSSQFFTGHHARYILIPAVMEQLHLFMASSKSANEQAEVINIVCWIIDVIDGVEYVDVIKHLLALLEDLLSVYESVEKENLKMNAAVCVLAIFHLVDQTAFNAYLDSMTPHSRETLLERVVTALNQLIVHPNVIPFTWFGVTMFQYATTSKFIAMACERLRVPQHAEGTQARSQLTIVSRRRTRRTVNVSRSVTQVAAQPAIAPAGLSPTAHKKPPAAACNNRFDEVEPEFVPWVKLFQLMIAFVTSRVVEVEKYSVAKAQIVREGHVANKELNETGMNLYFSMLQREFEHYKSFKRVERQTIGSLDKIVNEYDEQYQQNVLQVFLSSLRQHFHTAPEMMDVADKFMADMKTLISLFTSLRTLPLGPEYDDERTLATLKLMEYLYSTGRMEQYSEYAYQLHERYMSVNNFIEAGFTLLLQTQLLDWSDTIVPAVPFRNLLRETAYERKEALYKEAIDLFSRGKYWEKAIELLEELRHQYQHVTCEFVLLANILQSEADLYRLIVSGERFYAEYFHVGYYGMGFPPDMQNQQFVHRGVEFQRRDAFEVLISKRWPNAVIMNTTEPPGAEIRNSPGQHLQIFAIKMASAEEARGERTRLQIAQSNTRRYKSYESVGAFLYARPEDRRKSKHDNEFANLWIVNYYFTTEEAFPSMVRRSKIVAQATSELSPIDNAIINIVDKNIELEKMIETFSMPDTTPNVSPFTMVLKGVIDAAVNGGVARYEDAFLHSRYVDEHPQHKDKVDLLRQVLERQVAVLDTGLKVHQMVVPPEMADLQSQLEIGLMKLKIRSLNQIHMLCLENDALASSNATSVTTSGQTWSSQTRLPAPHTSVTATSPRLGAMRGAPPPVVVSPSKPGLLGLEKSLH